MAGFCTRHQMNKTTREHQLCAGIKCKPDQSARYWHAWESGQLGATAPAYPKAFKEGVPIPVPVRSLTGSVPQPVGGVGTELKALFAWFGQYASAGCNCTKYALIMDKKGVRWCEDNIEDIVGWVMDEAGQRRVTELVLPRTETIDAVKQAAELERLEATDVDVLIEEISNQPKPKPILMSMAGVPCFRTAVRLGIQRAIQNAKNKVLGRSVTLLSSKHAEMTPVKKTVSTKKNLAYHLWPHHAGNWKVAVAQLKRRVDVFDGVRAVGVAVDHTTATLEEVQAEFAGVRVDHWLSFTNNPKKREGVTFVPLLNLMPRDNSVTFWGHGKSSRHQEGSICVDWAEEIYKLLLDYPLEVEIAMELFPIAGCFKRYMAFGPRCKYMWHYSGGMYWFRNEDVFSNPEWNKLSDWFGCTESWPGSMFPATQAYCIGPDQVGDLYHQQAWGIIRPELDYLYSIREKIKSDPHCDESFFHQSNCKGYTKWDWQPLVDIHAKAVNFIKDELECQTVLELGSGLGPFLIAAKCAELDVVGVDRNALERGFAVDHGFPPDKYVLSKLEDYSITSPVDCIYSVEVFEHSHDETLDRICRQIADNCKWFYFTSTPHRESPERDAAWGHINIKTREEWVAMFARHGLTWLRDDDKVCPWGMVFKGKL